MYKTTKIILVMKNLGAKQKLQEKIY